MTHLAWCSGKYVAVVGRAGYLTTSNAGKGIDRADVVVRVNWTLPIIADPEHVGSRTDVLYTHTGKGTQELIDAAKACGVEHTYQSTTDARKRLADLAGADFRVWTPNTGTVAVWDALESGASGVIVAGFDFYRSNTYADTDAWIVANEIFSAQRSVGKQTHDPVRDWKLFRSWADRITPDPTLLEMLR